jgi:hypothetical protein
MGKIETIPPLVSCIELARSLPDIWRRRDELDAARLNLRNDSADYQRLNKLSLALAARTDAIDDMILETPAASMQDAVAKILQVTGRLIGDSDDDIDNLGRCLLDAWFVVARAAEVEPESIAFSQYVPASFQPNTLSTQ